MSFEPPGYCPNCGDYVEEGALACESCGSCKETGWSDESYYDGLDLPETNPEEVTERSSQSRLLGAIVSIGLLALLVYVFVFR